MRTRPRMEKRKRERERAAGFAVYYFVCWKAGLLARPGANRRRASMDAQVAGRPIQLHRAENMLHRVSTSTSLRVSVFPSVETFYATFPTIPLLTHSLSLSLSSFHSSCVRSFVRPSVCQSVPWRLLLYECVGGSRATLFCSPTLHRCVSLSLFLSVSVSVSWSAPRCPFIRSYIRFFSSFFPFSWLLWSEKLRQPHTCSHLSPDTGEGHGPGLTSTHSLLLPLRYYRQFLI